MPVTRLHSGPGRETRCLFSLSPDLSVPLRAPTEPVGREGSENSRVVVLGPAVSRRTRTSCQARRRGRRRTAPAGSGSVPRSHYPTSCGTPDPCPTLTQNDTPPGPAHRRGPPLSRGRRRRVLRPPSQVGQLEHITVQQFEPSGF